jgi:PAS domain S-box-containing protein
MAGRVLDRNALTKFPWLSDQSRLYAGIGLVTIGTFAIDVLTPHEFVGNLFFYYFAIFMSSRLRAERAPFAVTSIVSLLVLLGCHVSIGPPANHEIVDRVIIVATFWAMTVLAYRSIIKNREGIALRAASESARRLRDMIVHSGMAIQILDRSGNRLFINQALADMMGYKSPEAIMKSPSMTLVAPHDRETTHRHLKEFVKFGEGIHPNHEFDGLRQDGSIIRLQVVMQAIEWDGKPAIQRTFIGISDRLQAQNALEASERRFRDLIESSQFGIQISNASGRR